MQINNKEVALFFSVDWCPHFRKAKPEWYAFKNEYDKEDKLVNGYRGYAKELIVQRIFIKMQETKKDPNVTINVKMLKN